MNGFIFVVRGNGAKKYYFVETNKIKKCKAIVNKFLDYFIEKYPYTPTEEMLKKTYDDIFNHMYKVDVKETSTDFSISTAYSMDYVEKDRFIQV